MQQYRRYRRPEIQRYTSLPRQGAELSHLRPRQLLHQLLHHPLGMDGRGEWAGRLQQRQQQLKDRVLLLLLLQDRLLLLLSRHHPVPLRRNRSTSMSWIEAEAPIVLS